MDFRYLIPEKIFDELTQLVKDHGEKFVSGWIHADRRDKFAVVSGYQVTNTDSMNHTKPKSWMRLKKDKIHTMRRLKDEDGHDIVWQFHTHPDGNDELHDMDKQILRYLSTGVMILILENDIVGWFYDKRDTKKPFIDRMNFEVINEFWFLFLFLFRSFSFS